MIRTGLELIIQGGIDQNQSADKIAFQIMIYFECLVELNLFGNGWLDDDLLLITLLTANLEEIEKLAEEVATLINPE